jgi:hypothetical protein
MDIHDTIRVERGNPSPEELALVTALLLARAAAQRAAADASRPGRAAAPWGRPEREPRSPGPRSWRRRPVPPLPADR